MVATSLVDRQIKEGEKLIRQLDQTNDQYEVAFWMLVPDTDNWRLVIGIPGVDKQGTRKKYELIQRLLKHGDIDLSLDEISVVDSAHELCNALRHTIQTGPNLTHMSFFGNFINGQRFPDSIIYRVH